MQGIQTALAGLPLGGVRTFASLGSTNVEAARWLESDAPDMAVVVADEQTAGRGRGNRRWFTPPGAALAFSLVLKSAVSGEDNANIAHLTALGALAVCAALEGLYQLPAEIKWPNDVLVDRRKLAGILVEAHWLGDRLTGAILGIGINIAPASVPSDSEVLFPATCVEACLADRRAGTRGAYQSVERWHLLRRVLEEVMRWRPDLGSGRFLEAWESRLAFRNGWVQVWRDLETAEASQAIVLYEGRILGLNPDGSLRLGEGTGITRDVNMGEIRLRPSEAPA
ncbi:MAG: biotin--[acetyl-CoA-carboxylase] ligase [Anaerolineales bacterium]|nr:biotin--[acetyl-CoA-carboxylase] ligase [Anaerolineales bacterium]